MKTRVGYTGGSSLDPTYRNMGDHTETVALDFDQENIAYEELLKLFWKWHNPCTQHRNQYMSAIFYHGTKQKLLAEQSRDKLQKEMARPIATKILPAETFYNAENYHQKYILRQHHTVLDSLDLSDEDLVTSTAACKLNGYLGGYGTMEQFENDAEDLELSHKVKAYVKSQLQRKSRF